MVPLAALVGCGGANADDGSGGHSIPPPEVVADWAEIHAGTRPELDAGVVPEALGEAAGGAAARVSDDVDGPVPTEAAREVVDPLDSRSESDDHGHLDHSGGGVVDDLDAGVADVTAADDGEQEIRAAYQFRYDSYWACLRAPDGCDTTYLLPGGPAESAMQQTLEALSIRERSVGDDPVGYYVIERIAHEDRDAITVTACWWSTAVLYGPPIDRSRPSGPSNPRTIANDVPDGGRQADRFVRHGDEWRLELSTILDDGFAVDPCTS